jgi:phosphoadenosine phosphosulfate reductase
VTQLTVAQSEAGRLAADLAGLHDVTDRLALIARQVTGRISFSTSLGLEDQAILHAIATAKAGIDVFTLDTGRHFQETLDTLEASERQYGLKIRIVAPDPSDIAALVARDGINGFRQSIENRKACCDIRKVRPLAKALVGSAAWITGLRRDQSAGRGSVPFAQADASTGLLKLNPLADWTLERLEAYVSDHAIPVNPLHAQGYPSIGCLPCTRAIRPGEDILAGRWWWENEDGKECGLHNRPQPKPAPPQHSTSPSTPGARP